MTSFRGTLDALEQRCGEEIAVSEWVLLDQARIDLFAKATGDHQWIHVDPGRAAASPFGGTIAHGFLTLSTISALRLASIDVSDANMSVNYGLNRVRFTSPVPAGSRVRARFKLASAERVSPNVRQLVWEVIVEIEGREKPACVAEALSRYST